MPGFPSLLPALKLLQAKDPVTLSPWVPAGGTVQGQANGTWAAPAAIAKPYTCDVPTGSKALVQLQGGEVVTADLVVYGRSTAAPAIPAAGGRWARLFWQGRRYRVLGLRDIAGLPWGPGTCGIVCALDNGGET